MEGTVKALSCKLTSPELQKRKKEVLTALREKTLEKQELEEGFRYRFEGTDGNIDEVVTFIKTERLCCDFFSFDMTIGSDTTLWLSITGPKGAKTFISDELGL